MIISLAIIANGCGNEVRDRGSFSESFKDAALIGILKQLTSDERSIYPVFGPGDTIAFYQRLLLTDAQDTIAYRQKDLVKPYGIHTNNGELYTLSAPMEFPSNRKMELSEIPALYEDSSVYAISSPESSVYAFETLVGENQIHTIFLTMGDSLRQLSWGDTSCFLDRFSNSGRYLTAIYAQGPTWVLIFDLKFDKVYRIPNDSLAVDYLTSFSADDGEMLFIRSRKLYRWGHDFFGNIWEFKFSNNHEAVSRGVNKR